MRDAAEADVECADYAEDAGAQGWATECQKSANNLRAAASQVEQMRCETCANDGIVSVDETASALVAIRCPWLNCGGCFHHKPKVTG